MADGPVWTALGWRVPDKVPDRLSAAFVSPKVLDARRLRAVPTEYINYYMKSWSR
jgi:hypothetical protein